MYCETCDTTWTPSEVCREECCGSLQVVLLCPTCLCPVEAAEVVMWPRDEGDPVA